MTDQHEKLGLEATRTKSLPSPAPTVAALTDWHKATQLPSFKALIAAKASVIIPLLGLSMAFFLGVMLLAGFAREFMTQKVFGPLNVGYVLILATYVMCWVMAIIYAYVADNVFDPKAERARTDHEQRAAP